MLVIILPIALVGAVLMIVGFGPFGIIAGSIATLVQSGIGNVVAGSLFSLIQSFAALFWGQVFGPPGITLALIFILALWGGFLW